MTVTFDAANAISATNPTTITLSLTVAGTDKILTAQLTWFDSSGKGDPLTISWNTMELFTKGPFTNTGNYKTQIWYLINPTATTSNVVVTWSGPINDAADLIITSFNGAKQSAQPDSSAINVAASGNIIRTSVISVLDDCMLVDNFTNVDLALRNYLAPIGESVIRVRDITTTTGFKDASSYTQASVAGGHLMAWDAAGRRFQQTSGAGYGIGTSSRLMHVIFTIAPV